jgi:AraC-like DNA-binding protein
MQYVCRRPGPLLEAFVDYFWLLSDAPSHARELILPSGTNELVVNVVDDEIRIHRPASLVGSIRYSGAVVSGAYHQPFAIDAAQHASVVGVHFKPGGAFPFLGAPPGEVADRHVDLEDVWGRDAAELRERLCMAGSAPERLHLVEQALARQLRRPLERHPAVRSALDAFARGYGGSMRELARRTGLSQRRFIQLFTGEVGMTPKVYQRVRRFRRMLAGVPDVEAPDWAEVAAEHGYYDQSHLIHDFRSFADLTPTAYLRHRGARVKEHHLAL